jgi:hypothetical protein
MRSVLALAAAWAALGAAGAPAAVRTWTSASGATLQAELVRVDGGTVYLRAADGSMVRIGLDQLSEADRAAARAAGGGAAAPVAVRPAPSGPVAVEGTFEWNGKRGQQHELEGTLTPAGPGEWTVVWKFRWGGRAETYEGVVRGDLRNGKVSGTGDDAGRKRAFRFEGTAKDGAWAFDHFETTGGKSAPTGAGTARIRA